VRPICFAGWSQGRDLLPPQERSESALAWLSPGGEEIRAFLPRGREGVRLRSPRPAHNVPVRWHNPAPSARPVPTCTSALLAVRQQPGDVPRSPFSPHLGTNQQPCASVSTLSAFAHAYPLKHAPAQPVRRRAADQRDCTAQPRPHAAVDSIPFSALLPRAFSCPVRPPHGSRSATSRRPKLSHSQTLPDPISSRRCLSCCTMQICVYNTSCPCLVTRVPLQV
jgi:hypothetical protein